MTTERGLSVCMVTARRRPGFATIVDSLIESTRHYTEPWEFVCVDEGLWYDNAAPRRRAELADAVHGRFAVQHVAPKPTVWRGPWRLTSQDRWDKQSALNTAVCYARYDRLAFFDDQSVVGRLWMSEHTAPGYRDASICAPYRYWFPGVTIDHGAAQQVTGRPHEPGDNRLRTTDERLSPCPDSWLYGGNCSFPLEGILRCNGWEELLSGAGGLEDSEFSVRISRVTRPIWAPERAATVHYLNEEPLEVVGDHLAPYTADIHGVPLGTEPQRCKGFWYQDGDGLRHWYTFNHLPIWRLNAHRPVARGDTIAPVYDEALEQERRRVTAVGNRFSLRDLRECIQAGGAFPVPTEPTTDWRDGQALKDM